MWVLACTHCVGSQYVVCVVYMRYMWVVNMWCVYCVCGMCVVNSCVRMTLYTCAHVNNGVENSPSWPSLCSASPASLPVQPSPGSTQAPPL